MPRERQKLEYEIAQAKAKAAKLEEEARKRLLVAKQVPAKGMPTMRNVAVVKPGAPPGVPPKLQVAAAAKALQTPNPPQMETRLTPRSATAKASSASTPHVNSRLEHGTEQPACSGTA